MAPLQQLAVIFHRRVPGGVNVWRVKSAPAVNLQVGQTIGFMSNVFVMGRDIAKHARVVKEGLAAGGYSYESEVLCIVEWQKHWVKFSVANQGGEEFHLWVPFDWTALGGFIHALHILQRSSGIPPSLNAVES
ncbi:hypothetical protein PILCRDRAFT_845 [Piloderma croceum F 1598]|uniref:Uncharacterized protein n=1 Tax=Piloderma croceum (strain F 1598) TaxID=765440 RepID=A0A0C3GJC2_PILCF|nr:hypothetical protein PILCRDRAFT_845 [Piloderma croceum F 1598]